MIKASLDTCWGYLLSSTLNRTLLHYLLGICQLIRDRQSDPRISIPDICPSVRSPGRHQGTSGLCTESCCALDILTHTVQTSGLTAGDDPSFRGYRQGGTYVGRIWWALSRKAWVRRITGCTVLESCLGILSCIHTYSIIRTSSIWKEISFVVSRNVPSYYQ